MKSEYAEDLGIKTGTTSRNDLISSHPVLGNGWRDCAKDLPDDRRDVIIGNANNKCVSVGWWNSEHNNGEGKWLIRTVHFDGEVTHWMELPDPPAFA